MSQSGPEDGTDDATDAPSIRRYAGPWDDFVNRAILLVPWVAIVLVGSYLAWTGSLSTDIALEGTVPIAPFAYALGAVLALTYVLAVMRFYGVAPVAWLVEKAHTLATNYNPSEDDIE